MVTESISNCITSGKRLLARLNGLRQRANADNRSIEGTTGMTARDASPLVSSKTDDVAIFDALESEVRLYCRKFPVVFERARGAELYAADGRTFIDFFCAASSLNYGHNHPYIKRQLVDYLAADGVANGLDLYTTAKRNFLARFREVVLTPRKLDYKIHFCGPTGSCRSPALSTACLTARFLSQAAVMPALLVRWDHPT